MLKRDAVDIFGSVTKMATALEISRQAVHQMPEKLSQGQEDRIVGACLRLGIDIPAVHEDA